MVATAARRVAFFGGSFDPPHRGHLKIALAAADRFGLDYVLFAPVARQPLKPGEAAASFEDRLAMVALACRSDGRFQASSLDAPRPDGRPNYSIETLDQMAQLWPGAEIFNLVGADSFHDLGRWRDAGKLLLAARWIVVNRPGSDLGNPAGMELSAAQRSNVLALPDVYEEVSATDLRQRLERGDDCNGLLPAEVLTYIREHHLYR